MLKDANEREEKLLRLIEEREVRIKKLEEAFLNMGQPRIESNDIIISESSTVNRNVSNTTGYTQNTSSRPTRPKMGNSTVKRNVSNTTGYTQNRSSGPIPPKMGTFTGKDDWRPYFCHIVRKYEWSEQKKLDNLWNALETMH